MSRNRVGKQWSSALIWCLDEVLWSDDLPGGLVLRAFWEVLDSSQSGTRAGRFLHAKASWTPWKRHLRASNSSGHPLLCSLSTPANEQWNHTLLNYGGLEKLLTFYHVHNTTLNRLLYVWSLSRGFSKYVLTLTTPVSRCAKAVLAYCWETHCFFFISSVLLWDFAFYL